MKRCPYCAEEIQDAALICRYCSRKVRGTLWDGIVRFLLLILLAALLIFGLMNIPRIVHTLQQVLQVFRDMRELWTAFVAALKTIAATAASLKGAS